MTKNQPGQIGVYIKNMRHRYGISQGKLSEMVGVDVSLICRIENGSRSPSRKTVKKLAAVLAVDQRELLRMVNLTPRRKKVKRPNQQKSVADDRVGTYIKNMRQARCMTQSALAQSIGVRATTVSHIERSDWLPSKKTFGRILQALGTNDQEMMVLTGSFEGVGDAHDDHAIMRGKIDPLAALALLQEPVEIQRMAVDCLISMKLAARSFKRQLTR
jgi:transcriptional regulator with XRE-family HTH domain